MLYSKLGTVSRYRYVHQLKSTALILTIVQVYSRRQTDLHSAHRNIASVTVHLANLMSFACSTNSTDCIKIHAWLLVRIAHAQHRCELVLHMFVCLCAGHIAKRLNRLNAVRGVDEPWHWETYGRGRQLANTIERCVPGGGNADITLANCLSYFTEDKQMKRGWNKTRTAHVACRGNALYNALNSSAISEPFLPACTAASHPASHTVSWLQRANCVKRWRACMTSTDIVWTCHSNTLHCSCCSWRVE